jgi:Protein of unknown function (DUF3040)
MALAADEERALSRIEEELRRSDPKLAAKLAMFNRLTRSEAMPQRELLTPPSRLRRFLARTGAGAERWRLYPPVSSPGSRFVRPPGPATRSGPGAQADPGDLFSLTPSPSPSRLPKPTDRQSEPSTPTSRRWSARFLAILPVIVTVCAMGAIVAIFSVLGHVDNSAPIPANQCRSLLLPDCQSATAHTSHTSPTTPNR